MVVNKWIMNNVAICEFNIINKRKLTFTFPGKKKVY